MKVTTCALEIVQPLAHEMMQIVLYTRDVGPKRWNFEICTCGTWNDTNLLRRNFPFYFHLEVVWLNMSYIKPTAILE